MRRKQTAEREEASRPGSVSVAVWHASHGTWRIDGRDREGGLAFGAEDSVGWRRRGGFRVLPQLHGPSSGGGDGLQGRVGADVVGTFRGG